VDDECVGDLGRAAELGDCRPGGDRPAQPAAEVTAPGFVQAVGEFVDGVGG
jgi:hypothetical protein